MPTARELLEQAEALMRRNRAGAIDTEVPELTEVVPADVAPPAPPASLDDIPELTDIVEEIEIASIAELPDDGGAPSEWLHVDRSALTPGGLLADFIVAPPPLAAREAESPPAAMETARVAAEAPEEAIATVPVAEPSGQQVPASESVEAPVGHSLERVAPPEGSIEAPPEGSIEAPAEGSFEPEARALESVVAAAEGSLEQVAPPAESDMAPAASLPEREASTDEGAVAAFVPLPVETSAPAGAPAPAEADSAVTRDDWARWQALAEEIRMQVLQRIDIFTDTALREQLGAELQPIVDRASAEMIETINREVGTLLRAYIAEAIEREIEKWRQGNS